PTTRGWRLRRRCRRAEVEARLRPRARRMRTGSPPPAAWDRARSCAAPHHDGCEECGLADLDPPDTGELQARDEAPRPRPASSEVACEGRRPGGGAGGAGGPGEEPAEPLPGRLG